MIGIDFGTKKFWKISRIVGALNYFSWLANFHQTKRFFTIIWNENGPIPTIPICLWPFFHFDKDIYALKKEKIDWLNQIELNQFVSVKAVSIFIVFPSCIANISFRSRSYRSAHRWCPVLYQLIDRWYDLIFLLHTQFFEWL